MTVATTSPFALPYPAGTDTPNVPYWNQQLAQRVRDLLDLPAPLQSYYANGGNNVTSTTWATMPNVSPVPLTLSHKAIVEVTIQGHFGGQSTSVGGRVALQASGALNDSRTQLREIALCPQDRAHTTLSHVFVCPAGTTTFTALAMVSAGTTGFNCDYSRLDVVPLRVAA